MDPRPWIVLLLALSLMSLIGSGVSAEGTRVEGEDDNNNTFETAQRISEGSKGGMVTDGGSFGNDTDFYVISVPPFHTLGINVERFKLPLQGEVIVNCYRRVNETKPEVFLISGEDGKKDVDYWVNRGSHTKDIYIKVSGRGMYFIETITFFDLSNLVKPYLPPIALLGIILTFSLGMLLGLYIGRKDSGGIDQRMIRWGEERKKGMIHYILKIGLSVGLILTIVLVPFNEMIHSSHTLRIFFGMFLIRSLTYFGFGIIFAYFTWRRSEKAYDGWLEKKENEKRIRPRWGRSRPGSIRP
jgi:hypothetical protein